MEEIWKDIPNYPGYQASTLGNIRTHNKTTYTTKHGVRHWKDRILKFKPNKISPKTKKGTGYRVSLWKNGKVKDFLVARIIATTFLEDLIDTKMTVNHKDGNRLNNCISNLEWVSIGDNVRHAFENNLNTCQTEVCIINTQTGSKATFRSMAQAGMFFNSSDGYISGILKKGKNKFHKLGIEYEIILGGATNEK